MQGDAVQSIYLPLSPFSVDPGQMARSHDQAVACMDGAMAMVKHYHGQHSVPLVQSKILTKSIRLLVVRAEGQEVAGLEAYASCTVC